MNKEYIPCCSVCISGNNVLCCLKHNETDLIDLSKNVHHFKKGDIVFKEGNKAHSLFCVSSGKVKIFKLGKEGKEQIIRLFTKGQVIGYRSLMGDEAYTGTCITMEDAVICEIPRQSFIQVFNSNPTVALNIIQLLTKDLKLAEQHLTDVSQKTVRERVTEALVILVDTFGFKEDNQTINVKITRAEIANMSNTTTESAIRVLSQLNQEGVIVVEGKEIIVPNFKVLLKNVTLF